MKRAAGTGKMAMTIPEQFKGTRQAQLVWFDPGQTTGVFVCSIRPGWLAGDGDPTWAGLRRSLTMTWFGQVGREAKIWNEATEHSKPVDHVIDTDGKADMSFGRALGGGADITTLLAGELHQLVELVAILDLWEDAAWGYESFVAKPTVGGSVLSQEAVTPIRMNARLEAIELLYGTRGRVPFTQPSVDMLTASDPRLADAGLYRAGMGHAMDAARHATVFLRKCRQNEDLRAQAWPRVFGRKMKESISA